MSTHLTNLNLLRKRMQRRTNIEQAKDESNESLPVPTIEKPSESSITPDSSNSKKRYARPSNKASPQLTTSESSNETKLLHNLIAAAPTSSVVVKPNADVLNLSKTQTILPSLIVNATCQLRMKDLNTWKGFVLCHPSSPQANVSATLYTGNKLFVVFEKKNVSNDDSEFNLMLKERVFTYLDAATFKPKNKDFMVSLYNAPSNIIIVDSDLEFDDLSNAKICFSSTEMSGLTSLHKRMIKFSFWPSNILMPHLSELSAYFDDFKLQHLQNIEIEASDVQSSLFIVSNHKFSEQSENVLQFIDAQPNSQLLVNKINDMSERFGAMSDGTHFMIGTVPAQSEFIDDKKKNLFGSNQVVLMVNPVNILFDHKQLYFLLFSYLNKFVMQASIVQVFTTDLINHADMFSVAFNTIKCFYDSVSCTLINHVLDNNDQNENKVLLSVNDLTDEVADFIPSSVDIVDDSETDVKRVENEIKSLINFDSHQQAPSTSKSLEMPAKQQSWVDVIEKGNSSNEKEPSNTFDSVVDKMSYEDFLTNVKLVEFAKRYSSETDDLHRATIELARMSEENGRLLVTLKQTQERIANFEAEVMDLEKQRDCFDLQLTELNDAYCSLIKDKDEIKTENEMLKEQLKEANNVVVERTARLNEAIDELENVKETGNAVTEESDEAEHESDGFRLFGECIDKVRALKEKYPHLYSGVDANFGDITSLLKMIMIKIDSIMSLCDADVTVSENQWNAYGLCSSVSTSTDDNSFPMLSVRQVGLMNVQIANFTNVIYDAFFYNMFIKFLWQLSSE
uniref:Nonstructural protein P6 n=1 Tax=Maize rough dwarf virus TaxID=10989 RepID=A0A650AB81_MRDV|nr:nonstructural protein P6 [Maize rough dwarf virus]